MSSTKSDILKRELIKALEKTLGIVTTACKNVEIARSTFYKWYDEDKDFANAVDDISNLTLDFAESQLHKQIQEGNTSATIFYLKTKGKKRGYIERIDSNITLQEVKPVEFIDATNDENTNTTASD